ncbi:MAG TPA: ribonuclease H-like domain-containing protein [Blastocatellia bacterium]|nr:ribonuclease H-like domain-containing protein [Blastocatellia bacterium]
MLTSTFCHIPGISLSQEQRLWSLGIDTWEALARARAADLPRRAVPSVRASLKRSLESLERNDPVYFAEMLPSGLHWRMFPDFRRSIAYLDIETTGLGSRDAITTIVLYDGHTIYHYVRGQNLDRFPRDVARFPVVVTYNGKCFDVPFIERFFEIRMEHVHIDLRYVLRSLGYTGGLKACERSLGLDRGELSDVDGYTAVLLWEDFVRNSNPRALETLLAYNVQDVVNLETLMVMAYNLNLEATPFRESRRLPLPAPPRLPFEADRYTLDRIKRKTGWFGRPGSFRY